MAAVDHAGTTLVGGPARAAPRGGDRGEHPLGASGGGAGAASAVSAADLAELMGAFNEVTARLESTHEGLRAEVARLNEELRQANAQLERSRHLAGLGQMAAGIAHEVRNPLGSIGLYARMLVEDLGDRPAERATAEKIAAAVRGLDGIVGDVLHFARELRVRPAPVCAAELVSRALDACGPEERIRGLGVDVRRAGGVRGGSVAHATCDAALVHQALVNIIRNALEAMAESPAPGGRRHTLTLGAAVRSAARAGGPAMEMTSLSVGDTGPGVPPEVTERMFNPFFTTRAAGTGLGLPIVHRIVDAHGGRIVVRNNTRGPGTTVELLLPRAAASGEGGGDGGRSRAA